MRDSVKLLTGTKLDISAYSESCWLIHRPTLYRLYDTAADCRVRTLFLGASDSLKLLSHETLSAGNLLCVSAFSVNGSRRLPAVDSKAWFSFPSNATHAMNARKYAADASDATAKTPKRIEAVYILALRSLRVFNRLELSAALLQDGWRRKGPTPARGVNCGFASCLPFLADRTNASYRLWYDVVSVCRSSVCL